MMIELELEEISSKHKSQLRNLEMQLTASRDTESDLRHEYDMVTKDKEELETRCGDLEDELMKENEKKNQEEASDAQVEIEKMKKALQTEKILKQQAVNKLAQVMNAKENLPKTGKAASKASSAELRKKEKENRKLQLDLNNEKEKFNQMVAKYQKDLQDLQATLYEESQSRLKLSMELDTKESELENLELKWPMLIWTLPASVRVR